MVVSKLVTLCVAAWLVAGGLRADESSHRKAVENMFKAAQMDKLIQQMTTNLVAQHLQQEPTLAPYKDILEQFYTRTVGWAAIKGEVINLYMKEFTEAEIKEITVFYASATGQKMLASMPVLMAKTTELAQYRIKLGLLDLYDDVRKKREADNAGDTSKKSTAPQNKKN